MKNFAVTYLLPIVAMLLAMIYAAWYTNWQVEKVIMKTCLNNGAMNVGGIKFNCEPQRKAQ
jgi:hypothetical protein